LKGPGLAPYQPFETICDLLVSQFAAFKWVNLCRYAMVLVGQGFTDVRNVAGGIDAWAARVDPSMPRY
jgi:hypothetical protein